MAIDIETLIQFGFTGIALFMMYSITYNHLMDIKELLIEIRDILSRESD
ncbi:hypothetical protein ES703_97251 [subsurface metagenome]